MRTNTLINLQPFLIQDVLQVNRFWYLVFAAIDPACSVHSELSSLCSRGLNEAVSKLEFTACSEFHRKAVQIVESFANISNVLKS